MDERILKVLAEQPYPFLFLTISGAHLYGFPSPDSDYDVRGVHLLPVREVLGLNEPRSTIEREKIVDGLEIDLVTHDAHKFFSLMLRRNGYVLEQIYSPLVVEGHDALASLRELARGCITRHHVHHYLGFFQTQWRILENELKVGAARIKPLLYLYRVVLTGIHLMRTGEVEANLVRLNEVFELSFLPELIERKVAGTEQGVLPASELAFHQKELLRLEVVLKEAAVNSELPEMPTSRDALSDYLVNLRMK